MIKIGDIVAHPLYPNSKGVLVDIIETRPIRGENTYRVYYIDGLGGERFQDKEGSKNLIFLKEADESLRDAIFIRYQQKLEMDALKEKIEEQKNKILKEVKATLSI